MDLMARGLLAPCLALSVEEWAEAMWETPDGIFFTGSIFPAEGHSLWSHVDPISCVASIKVPT